MVLVDTSVWVEAFRTSSRLRLEEMVEFDEVVTCLPVIQEVLQGFRDERAFQVASEAMWALPLIAAPLDAGIVQEAVALYRTARRAGFTIRSGVDCLIAACAIRHGATVLHCDRDFDQLARISPLEAREAIQGREADDDAVPPRGLKPPGRRRV